MGMQLLTQLLLVWTLKVDDDMENLMLMCSGIVESGHPHVPKAMKWCNITIQRRYSLLCHTVCISEQLMSIDYSLAFIYKYN